MYGDLGDDYFDAEDGEFDELYGGDGSDDGVWDAGDTASSIENLP